MSRTALRGKLRLQDLLPATLTAPEISDEQFVALCEMFPDAFLEQSEEGVVTVTPPIDPAAAEGVAEVVYQLKHWAKESGRGRVSGPDTGFRLPTGARRSPDAAWFENYPQTKQRFPVFAPQFVVEVRSPDDRLPHLRDKMQRYIVAGVKLAWLIDPAERTVTIYRPDRDPEVLANPASVAGEGPVEGFVLQTAGILD